MIKNIKIDISHVVSCEATHLQRVKLVEQILYSDMTGEECADILKKILSNYKQTEEEFDKRKDVIKAFDLLISKL